tara:strand:- start:1574 stop:1915 length:342 start_codon:yes stop_codon:yes gene_type:complete
MPVLDGIKAELAKHLESVVKKMSLGTTGGRATSKDGGAGNVAFTVTPTVQRIDDRAISITGVFDTQLVSASDVKEVVVHGATPLDHPAFRASFVPISKNETTEVRVDVVMEVK